MAHKSNEPDPTRRQTRSKNADAHPGNVTGTKRKKCDPHWAVEQGGKTKKSSIIPVAEQDSSQSEPEEHHAKKKKTTSKIQPLRCTGEP